MAYYKGCLLGYPDLKKNRAFPREIRDRTTGKYLSRKQLGNGHALS